MSSPIKYAYAILFYWILVSISNSINAQTKANLSDFVLYANAQNGTSGVTLSSSITIIGGTVGSTNLVKASNTTFNNSNIFSRDSIDIGGSVTGYVMLPVCSNYSGPVPGGGIICSSASVLLQPDMLSENSITGGSGTVTNPASSYAPGTYGTFNFSGNKTLTLKAPLNNAGPYIYYFKAFKWTGNQNQIVFNFNGNSGKFYIFIEGNADFGKLGASLIGGGADKIYVETHGDGAGTSVPGNSFIIANGSSSSPSKWYGTVYASRAGISIGSGTGTTYIYRRCIF
jgi:hypothetical protein